jgi:hypothetical protein
MFELRRELRDLQPVARGLGAGRPG